MEGIADFADCILQDWKSAWRVGGLKGIAGIADGSLQSNTLALWKRSADHQAMSYHPHNGNIPRYIYVYIYVVCIICMHIDIFPNQRRTSR